ncbi:hypothetical protein KI387_033783, partial [Taxus chinensis]
AFCGTVGTSGRTNRPKSRQASTQLISWEASDRKAESAEKGKNCLNLVSRSGTSGHKYAWDADRPVWR